MKQGLALEHGDLGKRTARIFRFNDFGPKSLPLFQYVVATVPRNKQTREETIIEQENFES